MNLATSALRGRALANLLRMGHCAPSVMKTALGEAGVEVPWLVKLCAALPGGIGNTRHECGGVTAPLLLLGLDLAGEPDEAGVPAVIHRAQALLRDFRARHGSLACRDILGSRRLPLPCIGVVRRAPERLAAVSSRPGPEPLAGERREACALLCAHLADRRFHCARAVVRAVPVPGGHAHALLDAVSPFVGGTACEGLTCSALTARVLLVGLAAGEIEDSPLRVLRMVGTMAAGGDAFAEELNAFNRAMNLGHALAREFKAEHGSTQCRALTGCDLTTLEGARRFVETGQVVRCEAIAASVAGRIRERLGPAARF